MSPAPIAILGFFIYIFMGVLVGTLILYATEHKVASSTCASLMMWGGFFWFISIPAALAIMAAIAIDKAWITKRKTK